MVKKKTETNEDPFLLTQEDNIYGVKVGSTRRKRLDEHNIKYLQDVCMFGPKDLARITGLDVDQCEKIWFGARDDLIKLKAIPPSEITVKEELNENIPKLNTKTVALDFLFNGGIDCRTLTEVYGEFGSGKTQFCHTMAVETINDGYGVVVIDCENTFKLSRYMQVAEARGYIKSEDDKEKFSTKIRKIVCNNSLETRETLESLTGYILENNIKLVIVDGLIGQVRKEYEGRGELSDRQQYLKPFMSRIGSMPFYLNCWVIFTNQVQADPGQFFGDATKPIGGNVVGHEATYRVYFKKKGSTKWSARMEDSPHHAKQDVTFLLNNKGIDDEPDEKKRIEKLQKSGETVETVEEPEVTEQDLKDAELLLED